MGVFCVVFYAAWLGLVKTRWEANGSLSFLQMSWSPLGNSYVSLRVQSFILILRWSPVEQV